MCSSQLRKWLQNWWKTFFHFRGGKDLNKKWIYNVNSKSCLPPKNCWWNFKFICVMNVNCSKKIFERATQFSKQGLDRGMENERWLSGGLIWKKLSFQSRLESFFHINPPLIIDEMRLQNSVQYHSTNFSGQDEEGNIYKGIVNFMIVTLKQSIPVVIKSYPETKMNRK